MNQLIFTPFIEFVGIFDIKTFEMTEGDLPIKAQQLVKECLALHYEELLIMWNSQKLGKINPL